MKKPSWRKKAQNSAEPNPITHPIPYRTWCSAPGHLVHRVDKYQKEAIFTQNHPILSRFWNQPFFDLRENAILGYTAKFYMVLAIHNSFYNHKNPQDTLIDLFYDVSDFLQF